MVGSARKKRRIGAQPLEESDSPINAASQAEILSDVEDLLDKAGSSKDSLTKYLKKAAKELEDLEQDPAGQAQARGLARALESDHILSHKDKDVQLCAARCFCQILRVYAPDTPFATTTLLALFSKFLVVLHSIEKASDPMFGVAVSILDVAVQTKCCLLLLDLAAETDEAVSLVHSILSAALDAINEENASHVESLLVDFVSAILLESDHISEETLDLLLSGLVPPKAEENSSLKRLTVEIIKRAEQKLQPVIQSLLTGVIEGKHTATELKDVYHHLIYQVHCISPQIMLPVLPRLAAELQLDQESKRLSALQLVGKLLAQPDSNLETSHYELVEEFVKRSVDQKVEIREAFLQVCPLILPHCSERTQALLQKEMRGRLMDFDEAVRISAVSSICKAISGTLGSGSVNLCSDLENVSLRLRDKKVAVRKEAATHLMAVFREACVNDTLDSSRVKIPLWILMTTFKDKAMSQWMYDHVLKPGLVSVNLDPTKAPKIWSTVAQEMTAQDRTAFNALLKLQASVRARMSSFCQYRTAGSAEDGQGTPPPKSAGEQHLQAAISGLARTFTDHQKAIDSLHKLRDQKDRHIFRRLQEVAAKAMDQKTADATIKELSQRLGGRTLVAECCRSLCMRIHPGLLPQPHIGAMLESLIETGADDESSLSLATLLSDAAGNDPHLFVTHLDKVSGLLSQDDESLTHLGVKLLAKIGATANAYIQILQENTDPDSPVTASSYGEQLEKLVPVLQELCRLGSPKTAKHAVRALHGIMKAEDLQIWMREAIADIGTVPAETDQSLLTKMEVYSCIGRLSPELIEGSAAHIVVHVMTVLLSSQLAMHSFQDAIRAAPLWSKTDSSSNLEIARATLVKVLSRAFVPDNALTSPSTDLESTIKLLDSELSYEVEIDVEMEGSEEVVDSGLQHAFGYRRLSAAASLMRLARRHDSLLNVQTFFKLALTMQDTLTPVRAGFATQLIKLVANLHSQNGGARKASKYAAILALGAMDPVEQNQQAAFTALQEYVAARRGVVGRAASRQLLNERVASGAAATSSGSAAGMMHEQPEFMLPFLIQILAHHPDLPGQEDLTQGSIADCLQPFGVMLQCALQTLLIPPDTTKELTINSYTLVLKLLRTIKATEDASQESLTEHVHLMCDIGLILARQLVKLVTKSEEITVPKVTGGVPLPRQLFRPVSARRQETSNKASKALQDYRPQLDMELVQRFYKPAHSKTGSTMRSKMPNPLSAVKSGSKLSTRNANAGTSQSRPRPGLPEKTPIRAKEAVQTRESSTKRRQRRQTLADASQQKLASSNKKPRTGERDSDKENRVPKDNQAPDVALDLAAPSESTDFPPSEDAAVGIEGHKEVQCSNPGLKSASKEVQNLVSNPDSLEKVATELSLDAKFAPTVAARTRNQIKDQRAPAKNVEEQFIEKAEPFVDKLVVIDKKQKPRAVQSKKGPEAPAKRKRGRPRKQAA